MTLYVFVHAERNIFPPMVEGRNILWSAAVGAAFAALAVRCLLYWWAEVATFELASSADHTAYSI